MKKVRKSRKPRKQRKSRRKTRMRGGDGEECQYKFDELKWPSNFGCQENEAEITLEVDTLLDRIGYPGGFYLGTPEASFDSRSMTTSRPGAACKDYFDKNIRSGTPPYTIYKVAKPFKVNTCNAAAAFDHKGGATQYRLTETSIENPTSYDITLKMNIATADGAKKDGYVPDVGEMVSLGYLTIVASTISNTFTQPTKFPDFE